MRRRTYTLKKSEGGKFPVVVEASESEIVIERGVDNAITVAKGDNILSELNALIAALQKAREEVLCY